MMSYERPAGRIKAVYGRTKGLVARRKALMVKGTVNQSSNIIEVGSSSSGSEDGGHDEKENVVPSSSPSKRASKVAAMVFLHAQISAISNDSEDEVVKPSRWRNERRAKVRKEKPRAIVKDIDDSDDEEGAEGADDVGDLARALKSTLKVKLPDEGTIVDSKPPAEEKTGLQALLSLCGQDTPSNISEFLYELEDQLGSSRWRIFGEASFSEVYGLRGTNSVVKIIPLLDDDDEQKAACDSSLPDRSPASDVLREIEMTRALSKVSDGFIKMYSAQVLEGPYPYRQLGARAARASKPSESSSTSPESFSPTQKYAALVLHNGGEDLESYEDLSWKQAASIFCQVVQTLSQGEEAHHFEHRDLHWGNVVIAPVDGDHEDADLIKGKQIEQFRDASCSGVKATIIDYTLSRAKIGKTTIAYDFNDQSIFEGRGDVDMQFEVYRQMKRETNEDWLAFHPHTNVLWLNYLASKLIDEKHIPNPKRRSRLDHRGSEELRCRNFLMEVKQLLLSKRIESASDLNDLLVTIDF